MAARSLVLIHKKTKQRYPLRGVDFVIGRAKGDLVFDHDPKLSSKHCLIRLTEQGYAIHDLKTRTGVMINGIALPAGKACILKPGAEVTVGDQHFIVGEETRARPRPGPRPLVVGAGVAITLVLLVGLGLALGPSAKRDPGIAPAPADFNTIQVEMLEAVGRLQSFGEAVRTHRMTEEQTLEALRQDLIPRFQSVHNQLQAYRTRKADKPEHVDLQRRMAGVYLGQVNAMAKFIATKDARYSVELGEYNRQMQTINEQAQRDLETTRDPSSVVGQ